MTGRGVFIDDSPRPARPGPKRMGAIKPNSQDTAAWKLRQLIKQQQFFAAGEAKKREALIKHQQRFSADEGKKRGQLQRDQQAFAAEQDKKRQQIMQQQQHLLAEKQKPLEGLKKQWASQSVINLQPVIASVTSDLVSANVIQDKNDLVKFNLTNAALMVNGIKQPEELHEKLKVKYLDRANYQLNPGFTADPNFGLHFNAKNGSRGLGITDGPDSP
jgi:hypothetical protein